MFSRSLKHPAYGTIRHRLDVLEPMVALCHSKESMVRNDEQQDGPVEKYNDQNEDCKNHHGHYA